MTYPAERTGGPRPDTVLLQSRSDFIVEELPEPPDTFTRAEYDSWAKKVIEELRLGNILKKVQEESAVKQKVRQDAYEMAVEITTKRDAPLPCGHQGIRSEGKELTCGYKRCTRTFDPSVVEL